MRALFLALLLVVVGIVVPVQPAVAAPTDSRGREIVLRGFNVSGSTKLYENGLLPFRSTADAATAAAQMRDLTGANAIRYLISWEGVQPARDRIDTAYLDRAVAQIREFTSRGIRVLVDYHQDLYSSYLFNQGSWYTGDGAPKWVIDAGGYPTESCGICILWGQNMLTNNAVRGAAYDFWRNKYGVQDAYLTQARAMLTHLRSRVDYPMVIGIDPFNEPFDGGLDGAAGTTWEAQYLLPFYQRFRTAMDDTGWSDRPVYAEPLVFWNTTFGEAGGFSTIPALGSRYVFNSHYYDGARLSVDPTAAGDGTYNAAMNRIRDRAASLNTSAFVSEFGNSIDSSRTPWMIRSMYQGLDSRLSGANFWNNAATAGAPLSATQWQWDVYSGKHNELMNRNPSKVQTTGDAWNGENHSVIANGALRLDPRVLDRLYPSAVAGTTVAFGYEDLARDGFAGAGRQQAWLTVPARLTAISGLTSGRQYGVLVWREPAAPLGAPTELHLPASFPTGRTVVVSDLGTRSGLGTSGVIAVGTEVGATTARRLLLATAGSAAGSVHVALVVNASDVASVPAATLTAARTELLSWAATL
ncbi:cellulase family glycosylhydrolase [Actinoplanes derwentensis]|uniref:Cellulase (Glycosyl hydrolase family 5) n=1 Tax=Actinoplanes derwentensis TaxID=113562 RepID=A0A1H2BGW6_9ACTN|nr:cellulase family glycosylhydrolase [Actinoplanes derwentensis]GID87815.1 endoglycosylceramidase [Actinoplanes derwentensis]SDT57550.1 Cellulase (glycosyl hydrolase family 5) [Actinoplanes derwentensis]